MRKVVIGAATVAFTAAMGLTAANAHSVTTYCGHGSRAGDGGHRAVVYEAYNGTGSYHTHQYKHDVAGARDHHPWQGC
jgi:hypothetical protein